MTKLTTTPENSTYKVTPEARSEYPTVGKWYWAETDVEYGHEDYESGKRKTYRALWCVTHIGSNYVLIENVMGTTWRIHVDNFEAKCVYEPDADTVIQQKLQSLRAKTAALMGQVQDITERLGLSSAALPQDETQALSTARGDIDVYKTALVQAKNKDLPDLFKEIEETTKALARWMKAPLLVLEADAKALKGSLGTIEDRIFNVELYAGLVERVEKVRDGKPAPTDEKIRLMQRKHYMDEECLANYTSGGMDFENVDAFHRWLARPVNRDRILPFPRCAVAFQIRRREKERENAFTLTGMIEIHARAEADKLTFLYLRNGEQVYCLETAIEFGDTLFPDLEQRHLHGKLWVKMFANKPDEVITDGHYQSLRDELTRTKAKNKQLQKEIEKLQKKPKSDERDNTIRDLHGKIRWVRDDLSEYKEFTPSSVYYDDMLAFVKKQIDKHNRVVLVLQGLLDRSPVFHPHPRWSLWKPEDFQAAVELKHDVTNALTPGDKPDFEAYRARCNAEITVGTIVTGQQDLWEIAEAKKECERIERNWRESRHSWRPKRFRPEGNPGPGILARVVKISATNYTVTFKWKRAKRRLQAWEAETEVDATFTVSADKVFNVEAYKPGDYKQFYADPRMRMDYIEWAPLLLVAEDFHAGKWRLFGTRPQGRLGCV